MTASARVRKRIGHPVIDGDAHMIELEPVLFEFIREEGGAKTVDMIRASVSEAGFMGWYHRTPEERARERTFRPPWGLRTKSARDLGTAMLPKLMYERLDDMGIDFCIQLPTMGLFCSRLYDEEARRASSRAANRYAIEMYKGLGDRLIPAAVIPMYTPEEALAELEHAVVELGHKVVVIDSATPRVSPMMQEALANSPKQKMRAAWVDCYGLDSVYDYDPLWKRCTELGVSVCGHGGAHWGTRQSISNYVHNHLGLFAAGGDGLCRSLFMGGVMKRFPKLQVGFLEGGVAWAATLLADLVEHWEKRNAKCLDNFDRKHLDVDALRGLWKQYGHESVAGIKSFEESFPLLRATAGWHGDYAADEFAAIGVSTRKELRAQFSERFFFGCEADDSMVLTAFDKRLSGAKLHAFFGSDIGHWDVDDLDVVVAEAATLVSRGLLSDDDFRAFMFENGALFHARTNPKFFEGTVLEKEVAALLARGAKPEPQAEGDSEAEAH